MAPYWEPWAVLNELPRRLKNWLARPELGCDTALASDIAADLGSETASERSLVEDDSDLLKRRMKALHLDPGELDHPNAQLVGIKTGLCAHCAARGKCMKDLDDEFADPGWGDWRNYCPNATTLSILSTLGNCVDDEQHCRSEQEEARASWPRAKQSDDTFSQA